MRLFELRLFKMNFLFKKTYWYLNKTNFLTIQDYWKYILFTLDAKSNGWMNEMLSGRTNVLRLILLALKTWSILLALKAWLILLALKAWSILMTLLSKLMLLIKFRLRLKDSFGMSSVSTASSESGISQSNKIIMKSKSWCSVNRNFFSQN